MAGFEDAYKKYTESGQGAAIAGMHDAQTQASLNGLKAAYDQNLATQQAAREQIGTTYQNSANNMQAQYERNRRNLNQQAAANGINTGAGSQQQLALQNVWNRDYGALQSQQAQAYANADLAIANLQTEYQNAIQQAQAQGDYRKMAALLDDYNTQYNRQMQQAAVLASYGDFSGYNGIYSAEQLANLRRGWIAENPLMAYNTGAISAADYYRMTGQYAPGHAPAGSSGEGTYSGNGPGQTISKWSDKTRAALDAMNIMFLSGASKDEVDAAIEAEDELSRAEKDLLLGYKSTATGTTSKPSTVRRGDYTGDLVWDASKNAYVSRTTGQVYQNP